MRVDIFEAARTVAHFARDYSTNIGAAVNGWTRPVSTEALVLMDLYDGFMRAKYRNPEPWPRPWAKADKSLGATDLSPQDARDLLTKARNGQLAFGKGAGNV